MGSLLKFYQQLLRKYPYGMQSVQTGILMASGDQLAQNLVEEKTFKELDFERTAKFGALGLAWGPGLTVCYGFLERKFGGKGTIGVVKKVAFDQLIFAPTFIFLLLSAIGASQGKQLEEIKNKLKNEYREILTNNYKLWPMVQFINFSFVPLQYQVLVVQSVALVWNTYVSYRTNRNGQTQHF